MKTALATLLSLACAGCAGPTVIRQVLLAAENPVVCSCATGCMEVVTTIYPYTAWKTSFIHSAFENCPYAR